MLVIALMIPHCMFIVLSSSYSYLSDISSDDDDDYFDVQSIPHSDDFSDIPAVIAANYPSFEYGDFSTHPTFPLNVSNNAQPGGE